MTNKQKQIIKSEIEKLLKTSQVLRDIHAQDEEYNPTRNNVPNSIVFIETAIQELRQVIEPVKMKVI